MVFVARRGEQALALRPPSLALRGLLGPRQPAHTTPARLRFGVLDWVALPIVLHGLPVLRLQHQALEWDRCSAALDLFARGGRLARLIRRPSRCVGPLGLADMSGRYLRCSACLWAGLSVGIFFQGCRGGTGDGAGIESALH